MRNNINNPIVLLLLNILLCIFVSMNTSSCIKDDDNDEMERPQMPDTIVDDVDSSEIVIDSTFKASKQYLVGKWMAEYIGYSPMQNENSAIRRFVNFSPDGSYDSHVQGINGIQQDSIIVYREFEHEHGTYSFDVERQLMTYNVEYDSLLNFHTGELEYNAGKVVPGVGIKKQYSETIWFSLEKEGRRDWIRVDDNLLPIDDHSRKLLYVMKNQ